jgi:hypothetical protein
MSDLPKIEDERNVLRWGGLAGILGGIIFILVFVIVIAFVGPDPAEPEGLVKRFPDIRAARTVENSLYLVVLTLWVANFLALYRALRRRGLAPSLFGSVLGIVGLAVLAAGALPHIATAPISDRYHAQGATSQDRATLVLLWQATQGIFDALFVVGILLVPIGLILLGVAMWGAPAFGKGFGGLSMGLGVVGVVAASALLVDPRSSISPVSVFALIVFHLVLGWKVYSLSRAPWEPGGGA